MAWQKYGSQRLVQLCNSGISGAAEKQAWDKVNSGQLAKS
jgi:hypothetical protein